MDEETAVTTEGQDPEFRYERKFVVHNRSRFEVEGLLRLHPARFGMHHPPRWVNNMYFDSPGLRHYQDNLAGTGERLKIRIRWYGDLQPATTAPVLEFKRRKGQLGTKERFELPNLGKPARIVPRIWLARMRESGLDHRARSICLGMQPVLINRYLRSYFISGDGLFRITVDTGLRHFSLAVSKRRIRLSHPENTVILEIKYATESDDAARSITDSLPFRPVKSSKYIAGIERLYGW